MAQLNEAQRTAVEELSRNTKPLAHMASEGSTDAEMAAMLGVPVSELKQYEALIAKARAELAGRVRRAFLAAADKGSSDALAYLAKTILEKADAQSG